MHVPYRCDFPQEIHLRLACEPGLCDTIRGDLFRWFHKRYPSTKLHFLASVTGVINDDSQYQDPGEATTTCSAPSDSPEAQGWVPVDESLPGFGERVAVVDNVGRRTVAYIAHFNGGEPTWTQDGCGQWEWPNVTHWLRMPVPPALERKAIPPSQ
jgi:hypothetical protein